MKTTNILAIDIIFTNWENNHISEGIVQLFLFFLKKIRNVLWCEGVILLYVALYIFIM